MNKKSYLKLVTEYGKEKADKALTWFVENHSASFRNSVKQLQFVKTNEYLWF
jgi:hypothetical protein